MFEFFVIVYITFVGTFVPALFLMMAMDPSGWGEPNREEPLRLQAAACYEPVLVPTQMYQIDYV